MKVRERPGVAIAIAAIGAALLLIVRPWPSDGPDADELVERVNAAYGAVPGYASTIRIGSSGVVASEWVARVERGVIAGFSDETGTGRSTIGGIATGDGIWLRPAGRACWTRTAGPEGAASLHLGEPMIPTAGARYEGPERAAGGWTLTVLIPGGRREYVIDGGSGLVRPIRHEASGSGAEASESTEVLAVLPSAPVVAAPTAVC